jgi:hypothetical protein
MDVLVTIRKLIAEFAGATFNFFRPPSANIIDGGEGFLRRLVYRKGRGEILFCHESLLLSFLSLNVRSLRLVRFLKVHVSTHMPAVSFCPAAHTSEWSDECPSQLGQGILDSNGFRSRHAPRD